MVQAACGGHGQKTGTKTKEWSLKGEVLEMVHSERAVNVELNNGRTRLFERKAVKKDTTKAYREGRRTGIWRSRCRREGRGKDQTWRRQGPRRSPRLAKKRGQGRQGTVDDPEVLPYYMEAVLRGWAGTKNKCPRNDLEESKVSCAEQ